MPKRSSQLKPMTFEELCSMSVEDYLDYIERDDNQLRDLVDAQTLKDFDLLEAQTLNINDLLDAQTLNNLQPQETQVQEPQNVTSVPNINNQSPSQQPNSGEMTLEEFLIGLGVVRAPSQVLHPNVQAPSQVPYPQQAVQHNSVVMPFTNNIVHTNVTGGTLAPHGLTMNANLPIMVPLGMSGRETNETTRHNVLKATHARERRRNIRRKIQKKCTKDGGQDEQA
ncbi:hypothetical protein QVD17_32784 [Tagetes erecta]|uniref:Uncharacterized protein n=1 Tax=Tagetes erecta TaxID=13708 RepID=A0AAD8K2H1_TARER|nr:hypothetical protein QVD17_32784 [Tagetes erecta]